MKAAIHFNMPIAFDGYRYTGIYTQQINAFGKLSRYFDELFLLLPVKYQHGRPWPEELHLDWNKTRIIELPYFVGDHICSLDGLLKMPIALPMALARITKVVEECDVIGAAVPSIFGNLTSLLAVAKRKPVFHYVRGDKELTLSAMYPRGLAHKFFKITSSFLESYVRWGVRNGIPTFVVGIGLVKKYEAEIREGSLLRVAAPVLTNDFFPPPDRWNRIPSLEKARILYVGRLSPEKGVHVLIQALAFLRDRHAMEPEVSIIGDGPEREHLEKLSESLKLSKVKFMGFVPHGAPLAEFYQNADVLIVPSIAEGFGAVIAEAMACGLPVIASDVGGIPTIVRHGINGLLVPPNSAGALADAIKHLLSSRELWICFSQAALETAELYREEPQIREMVGAVIACYGLDSSVQKNIIN